MAPRSRPTPPRERGASLERGLRALLLLLEAPRRTQDLAEALPASRDTVERILATLRRLDLVKAPWRQGREAWHVLVPGALERAPKGTRAAPSRRR